MQECKGFPRPRLAIQALHSGEVLRLDHKESQSSSRVKRDLGTQGLPQYNLLCPSSKTKRFSFWGISSPAHRETI